MGGRGSGWAPHQVLGRLVFGNQGLKHLRQMFGTQRVGTNGKVQQAPRQRRTAPKQRASTPAGRVDARRQARQNGRPARTNVNRAPSRNAPVANPKRLRCDWCRNTGSRPLWTGAGRIKTITRVIRCNHQVVPQRGMPPQEPLAPGEVLVCPACENRTAKDRRKTGEKSCGTCKGWAEKHDKAHR